MKIFSVAHYRNKALQEDILEHLILQVVVKKEL